ncbi:MAG: hypothetical protein KIS78_26860 [Labilithrix sp.]|nr:hypothetical protein [Labilithrix sp.]MCW5836050.1 hypothetical protein [Labilithrix sp.]
MRGTIRSFTCASLVALFGVVAAACSDDETTGTSGGATGSESDGGSSGDGGGNGGGNGGACAPEGDYAMAKPVWTSSGGKVCDALAEQANQIAKEETVTVAKNADGTYRSTEDADGQPDSLTLDAAKCELSGKQSADTFTIDDGSGGEIEIKIEPSLVIAISGDDLSGETTSEVTSATEAEGLPCTIKGALKGTRK